MSAADLPPHSHDVEEELGRVRLALDTVFATTPAVAPNDWFQQRQLADRYLTSFQNTAIAWMVCDRLLQESSSPQAAATMAKTNSAIRNFHMRDMHAPPLTGPWVGPSLVLTLIAFEGAATRWL